jgi:hypothetical protein
MNWEKGLSPLKYYGGKMENKRLLLGILAMVLVFGMMVIGCETPEETPEEGEINWNGHRYVLYTGEKSWTDARDYCKSKDGHLATITSSEEQEAVYGLVRNKGTKNLYWIGGYKTNDNWSWVTGERWDYTNWAPGEPNSDGGKENYLEMHHKIKNPGQWNDEDNSGNPSVEDYSLKNIGFICEWDN